MTKVLPVKQSCPVHPCTHVQVLGAVHSLFTPQPPVQIAIKVLHDTNSSRILEI